MGGGGGKGSKPEIKKVDIPAAATPAPPPETVAERPDTNEGAMRRKASDAKKRGSSALRIDLNVQPSTSVPGAGAGLSIPRG